MQNSGQRGAQGAKAGTGSGQRVELIATEEAFATRQYIEAFLKVASTSKSAGVRYAALFLANQQTANRLCDVDLRFAEMEENGIDMHLMSLTSPGVQVFDAAFGTELAAETNDRMAALIRQHPKRLAGLAAVAPQDPAGAAKEIERAMTTLGLSGVIINSHTNGEFLDEPKFEPMLEAAQKYRAPIYLHPTFPPDDMIKPFERYGIHGALWGFAAEAGLHAVRMVLGGVFDRFPDLQVVLGHMGEGLPYFLYRLDTVHSMLMAKKEKPPGMVKLNRAPSEYIRRNMHMTTSGMFWHELLDFGIKTMGAERIIFAVDYPYASSPAGCEFILKAPIDPAQKAMIMSGNARKLFRLGEA